VRSPYPRDSQRAQVERDRTNAAASYILATTIVLIGFGLLLFSFADPSGMFVFFALLMMIGGLVWRFVAQSALLQSKCIDWSEVPYKAKYGLWHVWYERAPDDYPYFDDDDAEAKPAPPSEL
jgi:hypothetical protein